MSYSQPHAVQHYLQGFGFGLSAAGFAAAASPDRGALIRQKVHVDEFKGADLVVKLPCPGPYRGLLNDEDDVTFLQERRTPGL